MPLRMLLWAAVAHTAAQPVQPEGPAAVTVAAIAVPAPLKEWLDGVKCGAVYAALRDEGAETPEDLLELGDAELERLLAPLKNIPRKRLLTRIAALQRPLSPQWCVPFRSRPSSAIAADLFRHCSRAGGPQAYLDTERAVSSPEQA